MYFLYILGSKKFSRHYIGITEDIENRIAKHNSGSVKSTKAFRPWDMLYRERFENKTEARKREIFLKKSASARTKLFAKIANIGPIV